MAGKIKANSRPKIACEITPDRVIAGCIGETGNLLEACAWRELAPGSVIPDLEESNLHDRGALLTALKDALSSLGARSSDVIAVLPDAAIRVVLLDFDALPAKADEAASVVRFRLKKSLPFDVDKAKVSYRAQVSGAGVRVVAAVALLSVIEEYESVFREAGFSPGVVLPSMLATLGAAEADRPALVLKVDASTTSLAILDKEQILLFRTLENPPGATMSGEQLAEEVYPSVVFFQDTYQMNIERIFVAGLAESANAAPALQAQTGAAVQELVGVSQLGVSANAVPRWRLAGVVGALLS
jgi:type IV pilus assembly protein PilM